MKRNLAYIYSENQPFWGKETDKIKPSFSFLNDLDRLYLHRAGLS